VVVRLEIDHAEPQSVAIRAIRLTVDPDELDVLEGALTELRRCGSDEGFVLHEDGPVPFRLELAQ
jgi:hypothetical protein